MGSDFKKKVQELGNGNYDSLYWAALFVDATLNQTLPINEQCRAYDDCIRDLKSIEHLYFKNEDADAKRLVDEMLAVINERVEGLTLKETA